MPGQAPRDKAENVNVGSSLPTNSPRDTGAGVAGTGYYFDDDDVSVNSDAYAKYAQAGVSDIPVADIPKFVDESWTEIDGEQTSPRIREPWVLTCQSWLEASNPRYIVCNINPHDYQWSMPLRGVEKKTKQGVVFHGWRDRHRGTYYDEPQLTINFQSGNIMPIKLFDGAVTGVPAGITNFAFFMDLLDEPKQLPDGRTNLVYISMNTVIFPELVVGGFFDPQGLNFSENSDNPHVIENWSAPFRVLTSYPPLKGRVLIEMYRAAGPGQIEGSPGTKASEGGVFRKEKEPDPPLTPPPGVTSTSS